VADDFLIFAHGQKYFILTGEKNFGSTCPQPNKKNGNFK